MASKNSKEHESETETAEALQDSSTELTEEKEEEHVNRLPKFVELDLPAMGLEFHPAEPLLAASFIDGTIKLYSCKAQEEPVEVWSTEGFKKSSRSVRFTEDGESLVCISKDKSWKLFNTETGKVEREFVKAHDAAISTVAVAGDKHVVTGDDDGRLKLWDLRFEKAVFEAKQNEDYLSDIAVDETNRIVFATSGDGTMSTFNIKRRRFDLQSENLHSELMCVEIVRRGRKVVCGGSDGSLNFYNWEEFGDISDRFPGHPESVDFSCKILDDLICTGSGDGMIRAVNVYPHRFMGIIGDHGNLPVNNLTVNGEATILASCGHDQRIKFWDVEHFHHIGKLEKKAKVSDKNKRLDAKGKEENFFADLE
ncbi:putative WD repeat-containing protein 55 isoform X2 [Apostichopus japonicus]|uniref:Putative WD repeat-containing protein 55 isoform X2 n=2 Tax=Stichopus japonicus TaxID=307972 RepID=A0A2G8KQX1_STIJA|nr:putative WD repeat-containing protein 55 isoform X2 [Apostichopus japonicus]